jgi:hypothetical protein
MFDITRHRKPVRRREGTGGIATAPGDLTGGRTFLSYSIPGRNCARRLTILPEIMNTPSPV